MNTFIYRFSILLATCIFLTACGEKAKEAKNAFNNLKNLAESDLDGSTTKSPGLGSVSAVSQRYVNENGDYVEVQLVDYVGAYSMYTSMFSIYASGFEVDNADEH